MAFRWCADDGQTLNAGLVALRFSGDLRSPDFCGFFFFFFFWGGGGAGPPATPPLDPRMFYLPIQQRFMPGSRTG